MKELQTSKVRLEKEVVELQEGECSPQGISPDQQAGLRAKVTELSATLGRITSWWKQRAKVRWLNEGDANSHFFHMVASARRRSNRIGGVAMPNGEISPNPEDIMRVFIQFFQNKWVETTPQFEDWPVWDESTRVEPSVCEFLASKVTKDEIWAAVKSMGLNRSPGADGITASFFKSFWRDVARAVNAAVQEFFRTGCMPAYWKDTLVVLLSKREGADAPAKFRPISLCQTIYKVVAKVLVGRMKGILPGVVSEEQGAFVPNRSISHHCLLAQEVINKFWVSTAKSGLMALKVDMEQAYDRMNWRTLAKVLGELGLPPRFTNWVLQCVRQPRFSLLINGSQSPWIMAECGFR